MWLVRLGTQCLFLERGVPSEGIYIPTISGLHECGRVQGILDVMLNGVLVPFQDRLEGWGELAKVVKHL